MYGILGRYTYEFFNSSMSLLYSNLGWMVEEVFADLQLWHFNNPVCPCFLLSDSAHVVNLLDMDVDLDSGTKNDSSKPI